MTETQVGAAGRLLRGILDPAGDGGPGSARDTADAQVPDGESAARHAVLRTRPARGVAAKVAAVGGVDRAAALLLRELTGRHLGGDPARWRGLYDALAERREGLPELLALDPAPERQGQELRRPAPRSVHTTLGLLLQHAEPEHAAAALAVLPERATAELLAGGAPPAPALVTAVVEHGDTRCRTALARHPRLDARDLARLLLVGDGQVAAAVYRNQRATPSLRRTVVDRFDRVPLDDTLRAELTAPHADVPRTWAVPLLGSGDPSLVVLALRWGVRQVAQQYALVRIWERAGADAVRALLDDPRARPWLGRDVVATVTEALSAADSDTDADAGASRRLRERCEPYEDPARLPELLATTRGTSTLRDLLSEPYVHDLDALAAAHAATPFMPKACEELARHEAASDDQRLAFRLSVLNEPWRAGGRRAGNVTLPAQRLAREELDDSAARWADGMAGAGLLDPAELIGAARPAAHALTALAGLAERGLLGGAALAELRELTSAHLGDRAAAWAALDALLDEHRGTVRELIVAAGRAPDGPGATTAPERAGTAEAPARPPLNHRDRSVALAALDLLYSLAPADAPPPDDPEVLRALAAYEGSDAPGLATPQWFIDACRAHDVDPSDDGRPYAAPGLADVLARPPASYGSGARLTECAYEQGVLPAEELLTLLPAHRLLQFPHDWGRLAFGHAWRAALARRLRADLGTDPDAWLRLAATVSAAAAAERELTWAQLIPLAECAVPVPDHDPLAAARPGTTDAAVKLLEHGDHLWSWPEGTLLCLADAEVVDAVLPRLGPDGPWLLAAYLLRYDRTPSHVLDRLLADRDPDALRVLAEQSRWLRRSGSLDRLVDLDDPDVDLALLRHWNPRAVVRRIVARSRPGGAGPSLGARVLADWRASGSARPAGGLGWLCSAEPDLVAEILVRDGAGLPLPHQLLGCLSLFEHGGAERLAAVAGRDVLGRTATTVCAKALASADPAAVIRARLDRELASEKLVKKLRRASHAAEARHVVESLPPGVTVDWPAVEAAHAADPIPYWPDVVRLDETPEDVRLRYAALLPEPGPDGLPGRAALTRERARYGLAGHFHCAPATQVDGLLAADLLTGSDLLHLAAPAGRLLAYLGGAARRTDAPPGAAAARTELAGLVRSRLGTDPAAWTRVAGRLTGVDPGWEPMATVAALLDG
ncbi:hypothetical protein ACIBL6_32645 [Streptomyces sp. NPDC050400]|uniref:hypothetical protein n=1 Tax=Streptomyces sp. NPDC050400 TaxID=3365610 RepID=UPI0037B911F6